ncbi:hypothetical protein NFJ02_13g12490 [Pycnococcus provasolii]
MSIAERRGNGELKNFTIMTLKSAWDAHWPSETIGAILKQRGIGFILAFSRKSQPRKKIDAAIANIIKNNDRVFIDGLITTTKSVHVYVPTIEFLTAAEAMSAFNKLTSLAPKIVSDNENKTKLSAHVTFMEKLKEDGTLLHPPHIFYPELERTKVSRASSSWTRRASSSWKPEDTGRA